MRNCNKRLVRCSQYPTEVESILATIQMGPKSLNHQMSSTNQTYKEIDAPLASLSFSQQDHLLPRWPKDWACIPLGMIYMVTFRTSPQRTDSPKDLSECLDGRHDSGGLTYPALIISGGVEQGPRHTTLRCLIAVLDTIVERVPRRPYVGR
jgi:hypothetical protein